MSVCGAPVCGAAVAALEDGATWNLAIAATIVTSTFDLVTSDPFFDFVADENRMMIYAAELYPYSIAGAAPELKAVASRDFVTRSTDAPANTPFLGTLMRPIRLDQSIIGNVGFSGLNVTWGELEINNSEGNYDSLIHTHTVDGRALTMKMGQIVGRAVDPYASFFTIMHLTMESWDIDLTLFRISARDKSFLLELPVQTQIYGGSGDLEGPEDLQGKRKPWALGWVRNVTPATVIPAELVYQVSWRAVQEIRGVYDGGVPLTFDANYADVGTLRAATIPEGKYATSLSDGFFRLGAAPAKAVTADVQGDNVSGYVTTTASIVRRILTVAGGLVDPTDLDTVSFDILNAEQPAAVNYFLPTGGAETVAQLGRKLLTGIGAHGGFNRLGKFFVRRFIAATAPAMTSYDQTHLTDFVRESLPDSIYPPVKNWRIIYERNWTVMNEADLIEGLIETDPQRVAQLTQANRLVITPSASSALIAARHLRAQEAEPIESYFDHETDAQDEELRLRTLYSTTERSLYRIKIKFRQFVHRPGDSISIAFPRLLPAASGVYARIVEVSEDVERNETTLTVFV